MTITKTSKSLDPKLLTAPQRRVLDQMATGADTVVCFVDHVRLADGVSCFLSGTHWPGVHHRVRRQTMHRLYTLGLVTIGAGGGIGNHKYTISEKGRATVRRLRRA